MLSTSRCSNACVSAEVWPVVTPGRSPDRGSNCVPIRHSPLVVRTRSKLPHSPQAVCALKLAQDPRRKEAGQDGLALARPPFEPQTDDGALLELEGLRRYITAQAKREQPPEMGLVADDGGAFGLAAQAP